MDEVGTGALAWPSGSRILQPIESEVTPEARKLVDATASIEEIPRLDQSSLQ